MADVGCIIEMFRSIRQNGVYVVGYDDFVESTINDTNPSNSRIGVTFSSAVTETVIYIVILIIVIIFIAYTVFVIILVGKGYISPITAICGIVVAAAVLSVYYVSCRSFTLSSTFSIMPVFQETIVDTTLYTLNSIFRNGIYLGFCQ